LRNVFQTGVAFQKRDIGAGTAAVTLIGFGEFRTAGSAVTGLSEFYRNMSILPKAEERSCAAEYREQKVKRQKDSR
jgi:hypothetical protein